MNWPINFENSSPRAAMLGSTHQQVNAGHALRAKMGFLKDCARGNRENPRKEQ
jgi:hypothetical protein